LNAVHPLREGNGRTRLAYFTLLAESTGHPLDLEQFDPNASCKLSLKVSEETRLRWRS